MIGILFRFHISISKFCQYFVNTREIQKHKKENYINAILRKSFYKFVPGISQKVFVLHWFSNHIVLFMLKGIIFFRNDSKIHFVGSWPLIEYQWPCAKMVVRTLLEVKQHLCVIKWTATDKVALFVDSSIKAKSLLAG